MHTCARDRSFEFALVILIPQIPQHWVSFQYFFVIHFHRLLTPTVIGNWLKNEPSGCATKCGVAAGESGTPGEVECDTESCNPDTKPEDPEQCPKTVDCGTFDTDIPIVNRHSHHLLLLHHHHPQPTQNPHQSTNTCLHDRLNALPSSS